MRTNMNTFGKCHSLIEAHFAALWYPFYKKLRLCSEQDILIRCYGASLGRICTGMEGCYNVAFAKVAIPELMDNRFVK